MNRTKQKEWMESYFGRPMEKISDRDIFNEVKGIRQSMDHLAYGTKDLIRFEVFMRVLEDKGFEIEEYTSYRLMVDGDEVDFDEDGNVIREEVI